MNGPGLAPGLLEVFLIVALRIVTHVCASMQFEVLVQRRCVSSNAVLPPAALILHGILTVRHAYSSSTMLVLRLKLQASGYIEGHMTSLYVHVRTSGSNLYLGMCRSCQALGDAMCRACGLSLLLQSKPKWSWFDTLG